jgi:hypothetical protein
MPKCMVRQGIVTGETLRTKKKTASELDKAAGNLPDCLIGQSR